MTTQIVSAATADQETQLRKLRRLNIIAGFAHLTQLILILVLANDFSLPVTAAYVEGPPGTPASAPVVLFDSPIAVGVALFFALSAFFHFLVASPLFYRRYEAGLVAQHNYFRWVEYSVSSSVMIVLIAQIVGISDVAALMAIFGVNASMILFGWLQEKYETPGEGGWLPFIFGCIAGIVPWLIIVLWVIAPGSQSDAAAPGFVYGIIVSLFIYFNIFALVQWLQYKRVGKWADYLRGERSYIVLSLVAKSALAWQIFSGTLIPA
jgi:Heliorhodopsin